MKDILLNENDDLKIVDGDLVIGKCELQEVGIMLRLNQGELKSDPIAGPNLIQMIRSEASNLDIKRRIKLHLERDNKEYNKYKDLIRINENT